MARIVLIIHGRQNRELLNAWLSQYHSVGEHGFDRPLDETCDLCIIDGPGLERFKDELQARRDTEQPGILPVLLMTTRADVWVRAPEIWHYIDDTVTLPVSKLELQARIEILLRARHISLELKVRNDDLEAFIQAMSHDLRASLRAVTIFADAMGEKADRLDEESRSDLNRIQWAAAEMRELIDSLLNFSRLGRGEVRHQPIDLRSYVESCIRNLHAEMRSRNASIDVETLNGTLHTDPTLLRIALTNLISNAIKFVPEGTAPEISISASIRQDICRIQVQDNGVGIPVEDQQRIFMPFVRLHREDKFPGIGLGLPSVRKAVELLGGRVGVESRTGRGSTFWLEFPLQ